MANNNPSILIMMATYNGENHIKKQIDGILAQKYTNWVLAIQDDGSLDNTVSIISDYVNKDTRIQFFSNDGNHGAYYNFHRLVNRYKNLDYFDYYMFADQDDYWYPEKISVFLEISKEYNDLTPFLFYADMRVIDADNNVLHSSMNATFHIDIINIHNAFLVHKVFGCNTFMNRALFKLVPSVNLDDIQVKTLSHDNYYAKFAVVYGVLRYIDKITMDFVRHGHNTTNQQQYKPTFKRFLERLFNINSLAKAHANWYNQSLYAIGIMINELAIPDEKLDSIKKQKLLILNGGIDAIRYLSSYSISWGNKIETISRKLILFLGLYKKYLLVDDK